MHGNSLLHAQTVYDARHCFGRSHSWDRFSWAKLADRSTHLQFRQSQKTAYELVMGWTLDDHRALRSQVPRSGLQTPIAGGTLQDVAKKVNSLNPYTPLIPQKWQQKLLSRHVQAHCSLGAGNLDLSDCHLSRSSMRCLPIGKKSNVSLRKLPFKGLMAENFAFRFMPVKRTKWSGSCAISDVSSDTGYFMKILKLPCNFCRSFNYLGKD